jgi:hypothetical protein
MILEPVLPALRHFTVRKALLASESNRLAECSEDGLKHAAYIVDGFNEGFAVRSMWIGAERLPLLFAITLYALIVVAVRTEFWLAVH